MFKCRYSSIFFFFFSSRRRHTRSTRDWSSDVCSSDLGPPRRGGARVILCDRTAALVTSPVGRQIGLGVGDRVPEIRDLIRERIIDAGHRRVEALLRRRLGNASSNVDTAVVATLIIGPLSNRRRVSWTYGAPPLGIDDDRLLTTCVQSLVTLVEAVRASVREQRQRPGSAAGRAGVRS